MVIGAPTMTLHANTTATAANHVPTNRAEKYCAAWFLRSFDGVFAITIFADSGRPVGDRSPRARWPASCECAEGRRLTEVTRANGRPRREERPSLGEIAGRAVAEAERQAIRLALQATLGNKSEAARLLRVDYKTLHIKMKRYGIDAREFRAT